MKECSVEYGVEVKKDGIFFDIKNPRYQGVLAKLIGAEFFCEPDIIENGRYHYIPLKGREPKKVNPSGYLNWAGDSEYSSTIYPDRENYPVGIRRFLEFVDANDLAVDATLCYNSGLEPSDNRAATTLVYMTDKVYFLVFRREKSQQRIPRNVIRSIIGQKDLLAAYERGAESVRSEMKPGFMTPFVSEEFQNFRVYLDKASFGEQSFIFFPIAIDKEAFGLPSYIARELLIGLYGKEKVHDAVLLAGL